MKAHWQYLRYVLRHKFFVFQAGYGLVPLVQLLLHDWTKFLPREWFPYTRTFYAKDGSSQYKPDATFDTAWNHHEKANPHHWQYWVLIKDSGDEVLLPMPEKYRREMLADWKGAGRALGKPDTASWYEQNRYRIKLHPETRAWVERELGVIPDRLDDDLAPLLFEMWRDHIEGILKSKTCTINEDGTVTLSADVADAWLTIIGTRYEDLELMDRYKWIDRAFLVIDVIKRTVFYRGEDAA
ncbi:MAG TPA: DUF5662 family protein [Aggregatilinea sp.]|nr:DUF5662 family protein [Aggregatilinea sp.]